MRIPIPIATGCLLIAALMLPTVSLAQNAGTAIAGRAVSAAAEGHSSTQFLTEVPSGNTDDTYKREAQKIVQLLSSRKNVVLIDEHGYARDLVLEAAATQLASVKNEKAICRARGDGILISD